MIPWVTRNWTETHNYSKREEKKLTDSHIIIYCSKIYLNGTVKKCTEERVIAGSHGTKPDGSHIISSENGPNHVVSLQLPNSGRWPEANV